MYLHIFYKTFSLSLSISLLLSYPLTNAEFYPHASKSAPRGLFIYFNFSRINNLKQEELWLKRAKRIQNCKGFFIILKFVLCSFFNMVIEPKFFCN